MQKDFLSILQKAREIYKSQNKIHCPYFSTDIILNSDGFNHLQNKRNREARNIDEQILKLSLLPKALQVIKRTGTLQEYRKHIEKFGNKSKDGLFKTKQVEYFGFHSIFGENKDKKIVVIIRRVGDGNYHFWSVMPHKKFNRQKLFENGIDEN